MLNIPDYRRNADQNYNEVSPHTAQNRHHQKSTLGGMLSQEEFFLQVH